MQHCSPEQLALAALREPLPAADAAHLADCAACRGEVAALQRAVDALAVPALAAPAPSVTPPPRVWDAIAAATGVSATPAPAPTSEPEPAPAPVVELRPRRTRWLAAAAAAAVVGGLAGAAVLTRDDAGAVVAATTLDPLDADESSGTAEVRERDGVRSLQVDLDAPSLGEGYYEVWLLRPDVSGLVPLGVVHQGANSVPLPDGLDLGDYPVVDVSVEPLDGDPAHSGVSVARGSLS
ncbi:anti-sigma factor [Modestobacter sp. VKM Ac-2986]|uniref:anti-sigma factor n=1 Tax=Modestobacter sp. VKM Ac-2986 TaxID=3004140 RepID=UPI0022AB5131|nr:anti-sigma factor [Modestobacter sp. VKM Ac-2986]MCZ2831026.1 anti-sigma factor [Modestobacter sp. VKM Ac-2986]